MAAAEYLVRNGYEKLTVFDSKNVIEGVIPAGVNVSLGLDFLGSPDSPIYDYDVLFRSPGIHTSRLDKARKMGLKVTNTTEFFFENCPGLIVGVTGTKGKGTTSTLIYNIFKKDGRDVYLGGNIGESPLKFLDELSSDSITVLELSSFQLQDLTLSPQAAVVLMTTSEHLDYHADKKEYWEAKKPILMLQGENDFAVLNCDYAYCSQFIKLGRGEKFLVSKYDGRSRCGIFRDKRYGFESVEKSHSNVGVANAAGTKDVVESVSNEKLEINKGAFVFDGRLIFTENGVEADVCGADEVGLLGEHNLENVLAAITVAVKLNVSLETVREAVREFKGLEHRLEFVENVNGVHFFNDSFSTTPETSIAAVYAFKEPVMLIAGGSDKGADYSGWGLMLQKNPNLKAVFLIGLMADRMERELRAAAVELNARPDGDMTGVREFPVKIYRCDSLDAAVETAYEIGVDGDSVVMSPAAASFDMFKNYKYRGAAFKKIVHHLKGVL